MGTGQLTAFCTACTKNQKKTVVVGAWKYIWESCSEG